MELQERIEHQIAWLDEELGRVKMAANQSGFDCTSAIAVIVRDYRTALKKQREILRMNLED